MSKRIEFRVTEKEYQEFENKAEKLEISVNNYAKKLLCEAIIYPNDTSPIHSLQQPELMFIREKLIQLNSKIERLPNSCGKNNKTDLKRSIEEIWDILS